MSLVAISIVAALAFAIESAIGFGSTVITATVGAAFVPLAVLLPAFVPVSLALSSVLLARGARHVAWRVLLLEIAPPVALGAAAGIALRRAAGIASSAWLPGVFASFVIVLATLQLVRPARRPLPPMWRHAVLVLAGIVHGLFGTGGPLVVYAAGRRIPDVAALRATLAVLWLALNAALVASFAYTWEIGRASAAIAFALPVGLVLGERLRRRVDDRLVWIGLALAGALLLARTLA